MQIEAQVEPNKMDVLSILSPQPKYNYDSSATVDIIVRYRNSGPNYIASTDTIYFVVEVANSSNSYYYNVNIPPKALLSQGDAKNDTLLFDYNFPEESSYSLCVSIEGTKSFQLNDSKNKSKCVNFVVNLNEIKTKVEKLFYANNKINFRFNQKVNAQVHVYDISGKEIFSSRVNQKAGELDFAAPASGFYLLRLVEGNGNTTTSKFIVSNK